MFQLFDLRDKETGSACTSLEDSTESIFDKPVTVKYLGFSPFPFWWRFSSSSHFPIEAISKFPAILLIKRMKFSLLIVFGTVLLFSTAVDLTKEYSSVIFCTHSVVV